MINKELIDDHDPVHPLVEIDNLKHPKLLDSARPESHTSTITVNSNIVIKQLIHIISHVLITTN